MFFQLGTAVALLLVVEGLLPAISPVAFRRVLISVAQMDDRAVRISGLFSMILGALLLYLLRQL